MDTARYVVTVMLICFLPPALVWWFLVHPFVGFWRKLGPRITLATMGILSLAAAWLLFTVRDMLVGRDLGTHSVPMLGAALLGTLAVRIALLRRKHLTNRILTGIPEIAGESSDMALLTHGIYARIRHPRYVEVVLGTMAYALLANHVGAYVVAALTVPTLHLVVLLEERELVSRFGGRYEAYRASVPRYVPRRR